MGVMTLEQISIHVHVCVCTYVITYTVQTYLNSEKEHKVSHQPIKFPASISLGAREFQQILLVIIHHHPCHVSQIVPFSQGFHIVEWRGKLVRPNVPALIDRYGRVEKDA